MPSFVDAQPQELCNSRELNISQPEIPRMTTLTKIGSILKLPRAERNEKIKSGIRNRSRATASKLVYSTLGYWLNRHPHRFMLEFRPDSHVDSRLIEGYEALMPAWLANNRHRNCGDLARFYMIYLNVSKILEDDVPGDFVELGVYKGNSAAMLATMARKGGRRVYLFDTFEGFDPRDLEGIDHQHPVQFSDTSLAAVQKLVGIEGVTYVKGFFPSSIAETQMPIGLSVVHIDCDLYEPMKAGLELFYPLLSPGGLMLLHDYSSGLWPGATRAIDEFFRDRPEKPILAPDKSGTAVIRKQSAPAHT